MQVPIATWEILDWQGPATNVRFRVLADDAFLARDNDGTHVQVDASPKIFREVDCVVDTVVIAGLTVKRITVPAMWLFSTNDAIVNKLARYSAVFITKSGSEIMRPAMLQSITLPVQLLDVFNPVPIQEIIRVNNPAAPIPTDRETFSKEQILELIGDGPTQIGTGAAANRFTYWQSPTTIGGVTGIFTGANFNPGGDPLPVFDFFRNGGLDNFVRIRHEGVAPGNPKAGGFGATLTLHLQDASTQWHLAYINDNALIRWANNLFNSGRLEFWAYQLDDNLRSQIKFDEDAGLGVQRTIINSDTGWLFRDADGFHLGTTDGVGIDSANKQLTFVHANTGIGINRPTAIEAQLDILSGNASRVTLLARAAASSTADIARFTTDGGARRFVVHNDGRVSVGQSNAQKGSVRFHRPNTANDVQLEPSNTGDAVTYVFPATAPANGQLLSTATFSGGVATMLWVNPTAGGDVSSDIGSVVDNTLTRFQSTTGKLITSSAVIVADTTGAFTVPNDWAVTNAAALSVTLAAATLTLQGLAGSSIAIQQTKTLFNAPAQSAAVAGFDHVQGSQTQSTGLSRLAVFAATYNQTSTAASTSLEITRTETALGSGEHNLIKGFGGASGTTVRFRVNHLGNYFFGATGGFIGDENGNEYLTFGTVASAVNEWKISNAATGGKPKLEITGGDTNAGGQIAAKGTGTIEVISELEIRRTVPVLRFADTPNSDAVRFDLGTSNDLFRLVNENLSTAPLTLSLATDVFTFLQIPVGPNSTPTTDNQLARKKYVDDKAVFFSIPFKIDDPSTFTADNRGALVSVRVPAMVSGGFITKIHVIFRTGSHTSGGTITMTAEINTANIGTVQINNTNSAANTWFTNDISDAAIVEGDTITAFLSRTGTITERDVTFIIEGFQKVKSL